MTRLHYPFGTLRCIASPLFSAIPSPFFHLLHAKSQSRLQTCRYRHYLVTLALVRQPSRPLKNGGAPSGAAHEKGTIKGRGRERGGRARGKGHEGTIRVMTDLEERPQKQTRRYIRGSFLPRARGYHSLRRPSSSSSAGMDRSGGGGGGMLETAAEERTYWYLLTLLCMRQQKRTIARRSSGVPN